MDAKTHRDIPVVHIPNCVGHPEHDVRGILLALEVVGCQQVTALAQVLPVEPQALFTHKHLHNQNNNNY